jgi:RNA recognition motif-containing protein
MKDKSTTKDLFVANLSFEAEEEDLRKLFALCGTVRSIHLLTDRKSGQSKGCAFVRMATAGEARDAANTLDGTLLINRCISVSPAQPRSQEARAEEPADEKPRRARRPRGRRK